MCTVAGSLLIAPLALVAQQTTKVWRIGYLRRTSREPADIQAFRRGLRELGYVEGQNLVIEERYASGDATRLPDLARELIELKVRVLVVDGGATVRAVRDVVGTTPLVFTFTGDPVVAGFVRSLDHPGGTMTGLTNFSGELLLKRLQLLRDVVPAKRVGFVFNPTNLSPTRPAPLAFEHLIGAARSLGIDLTWVDVQSPSDLEGAFAKMSQAGVVAALFDADAMFFSQRARIVALAAKHQLPAVYAEREFADVGGLMAYAPNVSANFNRAATYVDKILKGANPGDLPVEQPTKFDFVINLKAAKALGLTIPQSLLVRADEMIP
ncbi:MAG TPA: ABC transporter substrate-binding protein [Casimicrobiaceae bacterium]|nr:ABC transporter substrate-binding protein [Casimicrobiaceae bacterium]